MEPRQGPVVGAVATRARGRSRVRAHAGRSLSSPGPFSKMEIGQATERLHLCPARSGSAARANGDFCARAPSLVARAQLFFFLARIVRHFRVGSSSGSGVSCGGRNSSGTWRRFTRMRVHVDDLPRIESISTSSAARSAATSACLLFHLTSPASAASLLAEFATTTSGILV
jgi:hypothetical protein